MKTKKEKRITLAWMDLIRKQKVLLPPTPAMTEFLKPIIEYGESEEARITALLMKRN